MTNKKKTIEHGPALACYTNGVCGLEPMIECLCGEHFDGPTWEEVGADFDEHLHAAGTE